MSAGPQWADTAIWWHAYPLGFVGADPRAMGSFGLVSLFTGATVGALLLQTGLGTGMASIIRRACRARPVPSSRSRPALPPSEIQRVISAEP